MFQRYFDTGLAQASYLLACDRTRQAVVVDPRRDVDRAGRGAARPSGAGRERGVTPARRILWALGGPARWLLVAAIRIYQVAFSGVLGGGQCRFSPGCSRYAVEAIRTRGATVGSVLAIRRVLRCNPFGAGGIDPVPPRRAYDTNIQSERTVHGVVHGAR